MKFLDFLPFSHGFPTFGATLKAIRTRLLSENHVFDLFRLGAGEAARVHGTDAVSLRAGG